MVKSCREEISHVGVHPFVGYFKGGEDAWVDEVGVCGGAAAEEDEGGHAQKKNGDKDRRSGTLLLLMAASAMNDGGWLFILRKLCIDKQRAN
jgi:hypothetical protein